MSMYDHDYCKPYVARPIVYPTRKCEYHEYSKTIIPHIHPQHVSKVKHHKYEHVHYYPTTYSKYEPESHYHSHHGKPCKRKHKEDRY
ncbi:spore coat protein [Bacillus glycinifermentans]|nr:spore coat protein [Bacillus glycinifermentans]